MPPVSAAETSQNEGILLYDEPYHEPQQEASSTLEGTFVGPPAPIDVHQFQTKITPPPPHYDEVVPFPQVQR